MATAKKWEDHLPHNGSRDDDWEWRARRAEAEAAAARLMGGVHEILRVATYKQFEEMRNSLSWRLTARRCAGSAPGRAVAAPARGRRRAPAAPTRA